MSDLRSKLATSGTLVVPMRGGKTLPVDVSLKVLRFATTQDLGCLGRANTSWRDLSLRELTRLPVRFGAQIMSSTPSTRHVLVHLTHWLI